MAAQVRCRCGNELSVEASTEKVECSRCGQSFKVERKRKPAETPASSLNNGESATSAAGDAQAPGDDPKSGKSSTPIVDSPSPADPLPSQSTSSELPDAEMSSPQSLEVKVESSEDVTLTAATSEQPQAAAIRLATSEIQCTCGNVFELPSHGELVECPACHALLRLHGKLDVVEVEEELKLAEEAPIVHSESDWDDDSYADPSPLEAEPGIKTRRLTFRSLLVAPNQLPSRRTMIFSSIGAAATVLLLVLFFMAVRSWWRDDGRRTIRTTDPGVEVAIGDYPRGPRLKCTMLQFPKDYLTEHGGLVDLALMTVAADDNSASGYLTALASLSRVLRESVIDDNEFIRLTAEEAEEMGKTVDQLWSDFLADRSSLPDSAAFESFDGLIDKVYLAQQKPEFSLLMAVGPNDRLPHLESVRRLVRLLVMRISRLSDDGDFDTAVRELKMVLRVVRDFSGGPAICGLVVLDAETEVWRYAFPFLIGKEVRTTSQIVSLQQTILEHHKELGINRISQHLAAEQLGYEMIMRQQLWSSELVESDLRTCVAALLSGRRLGDRSQADQTLYDSQGVAALVQSIRSARPEHLTAGIGVWGEYRARAGQELLLYDDPRIADSEKLEQVWGEFKKRIQEELAGRRGDSPADCGMYVANLTLYPVQELHRAYLRTIAYRRVAIGQSMIRHDQISARFNPDTIRESLRVQPGLADPYGGQSLGLVQVGNRWTVYSLGPDESDEQAQSRWSAGSSTAGDLFLELD